MLRNRTYNLLGAIAGIGNVFRHGYHITNAEIIWETCKNDLKILRDAAERIRGDQADRCPEKLTAGDVQPEFAR